MATHSTASAKMSTGQFREFAGAVLRSLPDDLDETVAQGWIENQKSLRKVLCEALVPNGKSAGDTYPLTVNYERSVEEAVGLDRYDWTHSDISSRNFQTKQKGTADITVELVHFNGAISTDGALRELDRMGYRPIELHELLAFGKKYPDVQREFTVVALGSVWQSRSGSRYVPCLRMAGPKRDLGLIWLEDDWREFCRFAAVRK